MPPGMCRVRDAVACLCAISLGGCSLVLDFDKPPEPPPIDSAVTDELCMAYEPNGGPTEAAVLPPGDIMAAICEGGETDYFRITLDGTQTMLARIMFDNRNGNGDIDLRLMNMDGSSTIDESRTSMNVEEVMCPGGIMCTGALPAGDYLLQVLPFNATVTSAYALHFETAVLQVDAPPI
jgi:hypothetical protein